MKTKISIMVLFMLMLGLASCGQRNQQPAGTTQEGGQQLPGGTTEQTAPALGEGTTAQQGQ